MSDSDIFFPEGKEITVCGEPFRVRPFVLKTRTRFLRIVAEVLQALAQTNPQLKESDMSQMVTLLLESAGDRLGEIYEIVLERPKEWVENIPLMEEVVLLRTILEVNNLPFLLEQIKGLAAAFKRQG